MFGNDPEVERTTVELFEKHFPDEKPAVLQYFAAAFASIINGAKSQSFGRNRNDQVVKAIKELSEIASDFDRAITRIMALDGLAKDLLGFAFVGAPGFYERPMGYAARVDERMITSLRRMSKAARGAAEAIRSHDNWQTTKTKGPVPDERARLITDHCSRVFQELSGQEPTRRTDPMTGKAYGPFHEFVADVFEFFDISASAESQVRKVLEDRMEKKKPPV